MSSCSAQLALFGLDKKARQDRLYLDERSGKGVGDFVGENTAAGYRARREAPRPPQARVKLGSVHGAWSSSSAASSAKLSVTIVPAE